MDKFRIMIVDDQRDGVKLIQDYIDLYFTNKELISIKIHSMAKKAIEEIEKGELHYDFIFADLEFASGEDRDETGRQLTGKDVILAAATRFEIFHSCFFTVSAQKGTAQFRELERELEELNICFTSLLKDESDSRVKRELDNQLKKWTTQQLSLGISQTSKTLFIEVLQNKEFHTPIKIFGREKEAKSILIYWFNKNEEPEIQSIIKEFPNSFYDLPNISPDKLFQNKGLSKIQSPLVDYYRYFYERHKDDLESLLKKARHYLTSIAVIYNLIDVAEQDSLELNNAQFNDSYKELHAKLKKERINVQGKLGTPSDEEVMIKFMQRLWFRLVCIGSYLLRVSELDIFRMLGTDFSLQREIITEDNLKVFSRSLWLDNFSQKMEVWERNYSAIWTSLTDYERAFLKEWWQELKELKNDELRNLFETRELDKIEARTINHVIFSS